MAFPLSKAIKLAASPEGRKAIQQAARVARSEEGRKLMSQAQKVARSPEGRKLIEQAVAAAKRSSQTAKASTNGDRLEAIRNFVFKPKP